MERNLVCESSVIVVDCEDRGFSAAAVQERCAREACFSLRLFVLWEEAKSYKANRGFHIFRREMANTSPRLFCVAKGDAAFRDAWLQGKGGIPSSFEKAAALIVCDKRAETSYGQDLADLVNGSHGVLAHAGDRNVPVLALYAYPAASRDPLTIDCALACPAFKEAFMNAVVHRSVGPSPFKVEPCRQDMALSCQRGALAHR